MKNFVETVKNEKGITLLEVMATLLISSIVLIVIYNIFIIGIKTYERVGIEMQLRDEADYIVSSILKELYEKPIDSVESCGDNCITIIHDEKISVDNEYPSIITEEKMAVVEYIEISFNKEQVNLSTRVGHTETATRHLLNDKYRLLIDLEQEEEQSRINIIECINDDDNKKTCEKGLIEIVLHLQHKAFTENHLISADPIKLESKFGF